MTRPDAIDAIKRRWLELWPTASAAIAGTTVPSSLDNVARPEASPYFARVAVTAEQSDQGSFGNVGNQRFERQGMIDIRLSGPKNVGTKLADRLAAAAANIYESKRFGFRAREHGVVAHAATTSNLRGDSQAAQSWVVQVLVPFDYVEVK